MGLLKLAAAGVVGYTFYKYVTYKVPTTEPAAFAAGEGSGSGFGNVRNAGPGGMRSDPPQWDKTDETSDESFPASDPPGTY